ncbi:hypothetical protein PR003_g2876 [Phytophthora rubi]|uniref:Uncharacterized protein n=1 Tax=Phytophthora rubi TaxID=129364 RepID=A0A6A3P518_9STRA|nr:hypothetical protein PR002_g2785 [Phytophthora rubi]KAE9050224.1 hypothetical protein PR001_g2585 [Phytophthora rubi]KAE9355408.1 hypothetical protein PR003_g2876 [Phytophthora rubi]
MAINILCILKGCLLHCRAADRNRPSESDSTPGKNEGACYSGALRITWTCCPYGSV